MNLAALQGTLEEMRSDPARMRRTNRVEGVWRVEGGPQFSAVLAFQGGEVELEADQPPFAGGGGRAPGPVQYCLYAFASCFAATFATLAASEGIALEELRVSAESDLNFGAVFGLDEGAVVEGVRLRLEVSSNAPPERLRALEEEARRRCPAAYCISNPIKLETEVAEARR